MSNESLTAAIGVLRKAADRVATLGMLGKPGSVESVVNGGPSADRNVTSIPASQAAVRAEAGLPVVPDGCRLRSVFDALTLDGSPSDTSNWYARAPLRASSSKEASPVPAVNPDNEDLGGIAEGMRAGLAAMSAFKLPSHLEEQALLGLLERYASYLPAMDESRGDVSLYIQARVAAGLAGCLARGRASPSATQATAADTAPRLCFIAGDLSGIQASLFRFRRQGVQGLGKILRARSFLIGAIAEAAALGLVTALNLPLSCVTIQAAGRFLILAPACAETLAAVDRMRADADAWLADTYFGDLALALTCGPPFLPEEVEGGDAGGPLDDVETALDEAKMGLLKAQALKSVLSRHFQHGQCDACGFRPAPGPDEYCTACARELGIGSSLLRARYVAWSSANIAGAKAVLHLFGFYCYLLPQVPDDPQAVANLVSVGVLHVENASNDSRPWPIRHLPNYVPVWKHEHEHKNPIYEGFKEPDDNTGAGQQKTFRHIAAESRENDGKGRLRGIVRLGVLKADVDLLGRLMSRGFVKHEPGQSRRSLAAVAELSWRLDLFFTAFLPALLRASYPACYLVYSGGDDLLLVGPWRQTWSLAGEIERTFHAYVGANMDVTLSAGLALLDARAPLNDAIRRADEALGASKSSGRDRITAFGTTMAWRTERDHVDELQEWLTAQLFGGRPSALVYRLEEIAIMAETCAENPRNAGWRGLLGYQLARNLPVKKGFDPKPEWLNKLGLDKDLNSSPTVPLRWRPAARMALLRTRSSETKT